MHTRYVAVFGRETGQVGATQCAKEQAYGSCVFTHNPFTITTLGVVGPQGIEPRSAVPETAVLSIELQARFQCDVFRIQ